MGCASQRGLDTDSISIQTSPKNAYRSVEIEFIKGEAFNHPSFAVWIEDLEGNYIETLYVTQYVAKGQYGHGEIEPGRWKDEPGEARCPATLPYWAHKRGIQAPDGLYIPSPETEVPDAITTATPKSNFILEAATRQEKTENFLPISPPRPPSMFSTLTRELKTLTNNSSLYWAGFLLTSSGIIRSGQFTNISGTITVRYSGMKNQKLPDKAPARGRFQTTGPCCNLQIRRNRRTRYGL